MQKDFEKIYHQLETEHFWFKARRHYILQELKKADRSAKILDIGCSSGILMHQFIEEGFQAENLYGIDISEQAINNSKASGLENTFVMDAQHISLAGPFDIIIASDCLEHLKDEKAALNNWFDLLKPDGLAYVFVPAFMALWSEHDEVNMHYRRYRKSELKNRLIENGFSIERSGYWNFFLFLPVFLIRMLGKLLPAKKASTGDLDALPRFNGLLLALLQFESKLLSFMNFPVGVSTYCIAKKSKK